MFSVCVLLCSQHRLRTGRFALYSVLSYTYTYMVPLLRWCANEYVPRAIELDVVQRIFVVMFFLPLRHGYNTLYYKLERVTECIHDEWEFIKFSRIFFFFQIWKYIEGFKLYTNTVWIHENVQIRNEMELKLSIRPFDDTKLTSCRIGINLFLCETC